MMPLEKDVEASNNVLPLSGKRGVDNHVVPLNFKGSCEVHTRIGERPGEVNPARAKFPIYCVCRFFM